MRLQRVFATIAKTLAVFVLLVLVLCAPIFNIANARYLGFKYKSAKYHSKFAEACNSMLAQNTLGTNKALYLSVADASIPKIISDLRPKNITLTSNGVFILVRSGHVGGLAVIWAQDEAQTNWALRISNGEGSQDVVYAPSL